MSFYSEIGQLFDSSVTILLGEVRSFRVVDGERSARTCSFEPPLDIAMDADPPSPCAVVTRGRTFWIQLTRWGLDGGVPSAEGVVVKDA